MQNTFRQRFKKVKGKGLPADVCGGSKVKASVVSFEFSWRSWCPWRFEIGERPMVKESAFIRVHLRQLSCLSCVSL